MHVMSSCKHLKSVPQPGIPYFDAGDPKARLRLLLSEKRALEDEEQRLGDEFITLRSELERLNKIRKELELSRNLHRRTEGSGRRHRTHHEENALEGYHLELTQHIQLLKQKQSDIDAEVQKWEPRADDARRLLLHCNRKLDSIPECNPQALSQATREVEELQETKFELEQSIRRRELDAETTNAATATKLRRHQKSMEAVIEEVEHAESLKSDWSSRLNQEKAQAIDLNSCRKEELKYLISTYGADLLGHYIINCASRGGNTSPIESIHKLISPYFAGLDVNTLLQQAEMELETDVMMKCSLDSLMTAEQLSTVIRKMIINDVEDGNDMAQDSAIIRDK